MKILYVAKRFGVYQDYITCAFFLSILICIKTTDCDKSITKVEEIDKSDNRKNNTDEGIHSRKTDSNEPDDKKINPKKYDPESEIKYEQDKSLESEKFEKKDSKNSTDSMTEIVTESTHHFPELYFPFGKAGQLIFPLLITTYLLLCLTIVCDCFLVPSIQAISTRMDLSLDIAGATLMAGASSSPEFFINILATFLTQSDVGVGTVLGTGLYILYIVPALCILFASNRVLRVDYWPVTRDSVMYLISIILLVVTLADGCVYLYEAAIFIIMYGVYLIVLRFNSKIRYRIELLIRAIQSSRETDDATWPLLQKPGKLRVSMSVEDIFKVLEDHAPEFYTMGQWPGDGGLTTKIQWLLIWPIITTMRMTIPTFWNSRFHRLYVITFIMCVAWIGLLCYCIAWMITIIGNEISVPDSVMGLTLLAAGMSIPETISGVVVSNQGYATMALCNALGSNSFTICLCLGVPWLIKILFFVKADSFMSRHIVITSRGMEYGACVVLCALLVVFLTFLYNRFRLKWKVALLYVFLYIIFISISIYFELESFWKHKGPNR